MEDQLPYTTEVITPKEVRLTGDPTIIWNLHSSNSLTPYVTPIGYSTLDTVLNVDTIAHHENGKDFYLLSNRSQGYYTSDCTDNVPETVVEPEPAPVVIHGIPGGVKVPRAIQQKILVKVDLATYPTPGLAQKREKPCSFILRGGMHEFDELKFGMLKLLDTNYWINPTDNVIKPVLPEYLPDTRHDYKYYDEAIRYKADSDYVKNHKFGEVFSFKRDKPHTKIGFRQPVWIAGTFIDGERLYGIPANETSAGFKPVNDYGIPMSYLSLDQMDYDPNEQISDVHPVEAEPMIPPRQLTIKDNVTLVKAHGQKFLDGFMKGNK